MERLAVILCVLTMLINPFIPLNALKDTPEQAENAVEEMPEPEQEEPDTAEEPMEEEEPETEEVKVYSSAILPEYGYQEGDSFADATTLKGVIGLCDTTDYDSQHTMWTIDIADCVALTQPEEEGWDQVCWYEYEGVEYCMNAGWIEAQMQDRLKPAMENGMSLSVVFVLSYVPGREYLIDEAARTPGYRYYQPASAGEGGKAVEAFFDFFLWRCLWDQVRVDQFILGNEVNNPNEWNHTGTLNAELTAQKYAAVFLELYNTVRRYSATARCSISLDHNWTWNDKGREIPGKTLLDDFAQEISSRQENVDWCIAYHLYPAIMGNTNMWNYRGYTPDNENAMFIDAMNLNVLTDYVKERYGTGHRILLTEQGVTCRRGEESQATALALMYFAAKYNPMVDCFILNRDHSEYASLDFVIEGKLADTVYQMLDDGDPEHLAAIEELIQTTTGKSVQELIPNYGQEIQRPDRMEMLEWVRNIYRRYLDRDPTQEEASRWMELLVAGEEKAAVIRTVVTSEEYTDKLHPEIAQRRKELRSAKIWAVEQRNFFALMQRASRRMRQTITE